MGKMAENQWVSLGVISPRNKWSYGPLFITSEGVHFCGKVMYEKGHRMVGFPAVFAFAGTW